MPNDEFIGWMSDMEKPCEITSQIWANCSKLPDIKIKSYYGFPMLVTSASLCFRGIITPEREAAGTKEGDAHEYTWSEVGLP